MLTEIVSGIKEMNSISKAMEKQVEHIAELFDVAEPLRVQYVEDMQKDTGYRALSASDEFMAMIATGEVTTRGIANALQSGKIEKISTKPSAELVDAITALNTAKDAFYTLAKESMLPYQCEAGKAKGTRSRSVNAGSPGIDKVLSIDPSAVIELKDVGMSHPHIVGVLSNGSRIDIDCYAATLVQHVERALGRV
jgi:hypothetical protein